MTDFLSLSVTSFTTSSIQARRNDAKLLLHDVSARVPASWDGDHINQRSLTSAADPSAIRGARVHAARPDTPGPCGASRQLFPRPIEPLYRLVPLPIRVVQPRSLACPPPPIMYLKPFSIPCIYSIYVLFPRSFPRSYQLNPLGRHWVACFWRI